MDEAEQNDMNKSSSATKSQRENTTFKKVIKPGFNLRGKSCFIICSVETERERFHQE